MIHSRFNWEDNDYSKFIVWDIKSEKDDRGKNMDYMVPITFYVKDVMYSIERLKGFTLKFIIAAEEIDNELKQKFPQLFS